MKRTLLIPFFLVCQIIFGQQQAFFDRLSAIENNGVTFYNVDGLEFSSEVLDMEFKERKLRKAYRRYEIARNRPKVPDTQLRYENFKVVIEKEFKNGLLVEYVHYFVKNKENKITVFSFTCFSPSNPKFERKMINLILDNKIPQRCFSSAESNTINFAGREIDLVGYCSWMNVNNVQCPRFGQMNWSVHKTKESSELSIENQLKITDTKRGIKMVSDEEVNIIFEGTPTTAKKVRYKLIGTTSFAPALEGIKSLTTYYVSAKVRGNYVSCVLSFWNNDNINPSGLPPLLEKVMSIPEK